MSQALHISNVSKTYHVYKRPVDRLKQVFFPRKTFFYEREALKPVSLDIEAGQVVGIIGQNGSGKSTLLQIVCGTLQATDGSVKTVGSISALLELGAGFNPEFTGKENVFLNASLLGMSEAETVEKYDDIVAFSGLSAEVLDEPVKTYSSGMYVRLAFAVAVSVEPDIFVVDEALAVGDEAFQRKCYARLEQMKADGCLILFVSHSARAVMDLCDQVVWLDHGELLLQGEPKAVLAEYQRFLHAPKEQRESIRQSILKTGTFDHEMLSYDKEAESKVVYASNGAEIQDVQLEDMEGKAIRILETGGAYRLRVSVAFTQSATDIWFGMHVKTLNGIELGGASSQSQMVESVKAGDQFDVLIDFVNPFLEGAYFFNCGCSGILDGEEVRGFLHRVHDVVMFKVLPRVSDAKGCVDLSPQYTLTQKG